MIRTDQRAAWIVVAVSLLAAGANVSDCFAQQAQWVQRATTGPSPRFSPGMAYDSTRSVVVLFGGYGSSCLADTWEWNGTTWTQKLPTQSPPARNKAGMVYDSSRHVIVLFGGYNCADDLNDTWEYNGSTWTQRVTTGPTVRENLAMSYDSGRGVTVLFGGVHSGSCLGDTWEWNGTAWTQRTTTGPSIREGARMAYDSQRAVTVLFGGLKDSNTYDDTWEWNGTIWSQRATTGPSARYAHGMAYDSARAFTVLFGGWTSGGYNGETWEWNGTVWSQRVLSGPALRGYVGMAYDSTRAAVVLFGGEYQSENYGDTWEYACPVDINCEDLTGFNFGSVLTGTCSPEHTWTVTNEGSGTLTGTIALSGADPNQFTFTQGGGAFTLEPAESRIVGVQFCPQTLGSKPATLHITSNDDDENPCDLPLTGTGAGPDINCEDLTDYDWGNVPGACSDVHSWQVTNEGNATLTGTISLTGTDAGAFEIVEGGGDFFLDPVASRTVSVRLCCSSIGTKSATLHIVSNDPDENPCDKPITGTCRAFTIGGAVFTSCTNPLSGLAGVTISVTGAHGTFSTQTGASFGIWQISNVPAGDYTVTASMAGWSYCYISTGCPPSPCIESTVITVDATHEAANQSIRYLAVPITTPDINCEDLSGYDFGTITAGACTSEHTWTVTNEGAGTLSGTIEITGTDASAFQFTVGGGAFALGSGESRLVGVRFCPATIGGKSATLHITSNDSDENPCDKPLSGTGGGTPDINCEDLGSHDFGDVQIAFCSSTYSWLLVNEGDANLDGTVGLEGADAAAFGITMGSGTFVLGPGQSREVQVRFCPTTIGSKSALLRIDSNDPDENPCLRSLSGNGIYLPLPDINCEDLAGYSFGTVPIDTCGAEHTWAVVNEGAATLTGTIELTGTDAGQFQFTQGGGGFNLGSGLTRTVGVKLCPTTLGSKTATLHITSNDPDENPCDKSLSGAGGQCHSSRDLAEDWPSYCGSVPKDVYISLAVPGSAYAIVVEDQPPTGWPVSNISNGGHWDDINKKVKWGPFTNPPGFPTELSYTVTPPSGASGTYPFVGILSIDGVNENICGSLSLPGPQGAYSPADTTQPACAGCGGCSCGTCEDGRVEACEMSGYACAWRRGCNDDLAGMTRAATIWWSGECYCWDGTQDNWSSSSCPAPESLCCTSRGGEPAFGRSGSAVRDLPAFVTPQTWFGVTISLDPPPGVMAVALEDQPPAGWLVRSISDGGAWDGIHGKVKWGPYFAGSIPLQVSYEVLPPAGAAGEYCFNGQVSFDGANQPVTGDLCVSAAFSKGDMNCDGSIGIADTPLFVEALLDPVTFDLAHPTCASSQADMDSSGTADGVDVQAFVNVLLAR